MNIGFIGFGEVGYEMSKGFRRDHDCAIYVYDPLHHHEATQHRAHKAGVELVDAPEKVVRHSLDMLMVAVPATVAEEAWQSIETHLTPTTLYVDVSTASAAVKQRVSDTMAARGCLFVDGAIMGPLQGNQHQVPIMASGSGAEAFHAWGTPLAMNIEYLSDTAGEATNVKFIRSIFTKGLSTLLYEVMETAERLELEEMILSSITQMMDRDPFETILNRLITGNVIHSERRVKEMDNVMAFARENRIEPYMSQATRDKLQAITNVGLKAQFSHQPPKDWREVITTMNRLST